MATLPLLQALYDYNAWANQELLQTIEKIDPVRHGAERHIAIRLVNHGLVVGRIFAAHMTGRPHAFSDSNTADTPELSDLCRCVATSDGWYAAYLRTMTPELLDEPLAFTFTDGDAGRMTRWEMLLHVATHAGYHRGEVGRIMRPLAVELPWDTFAVYLHRSQPARRLAFRTA